MAVTAANGPEGTLMEPGLPGPEKESYGDQGSACPKRPAKAEAQGTTWRGLRQASRRRKLNRADRSFNRKSPRTRARGEPPLGVIKPLWGYRKARYQGLKKNAAPVYTRLARAHFYRARQSLIAGPGSV